MSRRYTREEKDAALQAVNENGGDVRAAAEAVGIPLRTLQRWQRENTTRAKDPINALRRAQTQLALDAELIAAAIAEQIEGAPLNQLASALGMVVDRYLKLAEHLAAYEDQQQTERKIRVEFKYPDGSIHSRPPWTDPDYVAAQEVRRRRLRSALWQDTPGDEHPVDGGAGRGADVVAGPDLRDGERGVARLQGGAAPGGWAAD